MSLQSKQIKRAPSLTDQVTAAIAKDVSDQLQIPGTKLDTEAKMSATYGVSRVVIREAISRLKNAGLVESFQGRGLFVAEGADLKSFQLDRPDLENMDEVTHIIELLAAVWADASAKAATRRTAADLVLIKLQLDGMAEAIANGTSGVNEDLAFHSAITAATRNPIFISFSEFLDARIRTLILTARSNTAQQPGLSEQVQEEHHAIYAAIEAQDAKAASIAAETHLINAGKRLRIYRNADGIPKDV